MNRRAILRLMVALGVVWIGLCAASAGWVLADDCVECPIPPWIFAVIFTMLALVATAWTHVGLVELKSLRAPGVVPPADPPQ